MAIAMGDEEDRSGEAAAGRILHEIKPIAAETTYARQNVVVSFSAVFSAIFNILIRRNIFKFLFLSKKYM